MLDLLQALSEGGLVHLKRHSHLKLHHSEECSAATSFSADLHLMEIPTELVEEEISNAEHDREAENAFGGSTLRPVMLAR